MGWLKSLLSPLKKIWNRLHSSHRERTSIIINLLLLKYLNKIMRFILIIIFFSDSFAWNSLSAYILINLCFFPTFNFKFMSGKSMLIQYSYLLVLLSKKLIILISFCVCVFSGRGIYILYKDVKSCPCEDVQVLWSILVESRTPASLPST